MSTATLTVWKAARCTDQAPDQEFSTADLVNRVCNTSVDLVWGEALPLNCTGDVTTCGTLDVSSPYTAMPNLAPLASRLAAELAPGINGFFKKYPLLYMAEHDGKSPIISEGGVRRMKFATIVRLKPALRFDPASPASSASLQMTAAQIVTAEQSEGNSLMVMLPPPSIMVMVENRSNMNQFSRSTQEFVPLWKLMNTSEMGSWMERLGRGSSAEMGFTVQSRVLQSMTIAGVRQEFRRRVWVRLGVSTRIPGVSSVDLPASGLVSLEGKRPIDLVLAAESGQFPKITITYQEDPAGDDSGEQANVVPAGQDSEEKSGFNGWWVVLGVFLLLVLLFRMRVVYVSVADSRAARALDRQRAESSQAETTELSNIGAG